MGVEAATIASARIVVNIGNMFSSLIHSVARNSSLDKQSFGYAILGFALTEAIVLFGHHFIYVDFKIAVGFGMYHY
jgi:F-type H+-transporting ATPase subunit c